MHSHTHVTESTKTGLKAYMQVYRGKIQCVVACQWLKLQLPNFHVTQHIPLKPFSKQVAKKQVSRQFK